MRLFIYRYCYPSDVEAEGQSGRENEARKMKKILPIARWAAVRSAGEFLACFSARRFRTLPSRRHEREPPDRASATFGAGASSSWGRVEREACRTFSEPRRIRRRRDRQRRTKRAPYFWLTNVLFVVDRHARITTPATLSRRTDSCTR